MKFLYLLQEYAGRSVSRLCFSSACCICHGPSTYQPLCKTCRDRYSRELAASFTGKRCRYCGRLLISEEQVCTECRIEDSLFPRYSTLLSEPFPLFSYLGTRKRLLTTWKITGQRSLSFLYAGWVYTVLSQRYAGLPVVPVPPRRNKLKKTGWDQIEHLCRILEAVYGVTVLRVLERTTTIQQKKLNRQQRLGSEGAGYVPLPENKLRRVMKQQPVPKRVVLLDDVITTGATVVHAALALQQAGVETVIPLSLFYVP